MFRVDPPLIGSVFPTKRPHAEVVEERIDEQAIFMSAAYGIVSRGRTAHVGIGADGKYHLRRRDRQVRRDFQKGYAWMAMPKDAPLIRKWVAPWWWI